MGFLKLVPFKKKKGTTEKGNKQQNNSPDGAIIKAESIPELETLMSQTTDERNRKYLKKKLYRKYLDHILKSKNHEKSLKYLDKIDDEGILAAISYRSSCVETAMTAAEKLTSQELIIKVFRNTDSKSICETLLTNDLPESTLKKISTSAASKSIRKHVIEILDLKNKTPKHEVSPHSNENTYSKWKSKIESREKICVEVENLSRATDTGTLDILAVLESEWNNPDDIPSRFMEILEKRFIKAAGKVRKAVYDAEKQKIAKQQNLERLENICIETENILEQVSDVNKQNRELQKLKKSWSSVAKNLIADDISPLQKRFDCVENSIREALEHKQNLQNEATAELQRYLQEVKNALTEEHFKDSSARIREIRQIVNENDKFKQKFCSKILHDFKHNCHLFFVRLKDIYEAAEYERCASSVLKHDLCKKAEELTHEQDMHKVSKQLKGLHSAWREAGHAHREEETQLWETFKATCDILHNKTSEFFENQKQERISNMEKKIAMAAEVEKLKNSTDWRSTAERLKHLQQEWKETGPCPKGKGNDVYSQFRKGCNTFFEHRKEHYSELKKSWTANAEIKKTLINKVAKLYDMDCRDAIKCARGIREEWKNSEKAEFSEEQKLWNEFNEKMDSFFKHLDSIRPENMKKKLELCETSEKFLVELKSQSDINFGEKAKEAEDLLRKWKAIGPAPKEKEEELWERFDAPLKEFYGMRKEFFKHIDEKRSNSMSKKLHLIEELEQIIEHTENWNEAADKVKELQHKWKEAGATFHDKEKELWDQFHEMCEDFFNKRKIFFDKLRKERDINIKKKLELCVRMEKLAGIEAPENSHISHTSMADELSFALQSGGLNDHGRGHEIDQTKQIHEEWRHIGFCGKSDEQLYKRYKRARDAFFKH